MRLLIAGVSSSTGRRLAEHLLAAPDVERVIGLDASRCSPPVPGLHFVRASLRQPDWTPLLGQVDAAILVTGLHWPPRWRDRAAEPALVEDSKAFVRAALQAAVPRIITAHSAALYGPQADGPITEAAPLRGSQASAYARARALVADYLEIMAESGYNGIFTRLRPAWISGPHHLDLIRHLTGGPVLAFGYEEQRLQAVHEDDLLAAFDLALRHDLPGVYNVCADQGMTFRQVAVWMGESRDSLPLPWLTLRAGWHWRWRGQPSPPAWVRSLYLSQPVAGDRLRAAGWTPRHTTREALSAALEVFRSESRE